MEEFAALDQSSKFPHSVNINAASQVPPAHTKTWAYFEEGEIKGVFNAEYYRESGLSDKMYHVMLLDDAVFPHTVRLEDGRSVPHALTLDEEEASHSLKDSQLRQEIFLNERNGSVI